MTLGHASGSLNGVYGGGCGKGCDDEDGGEDGGELHIGLLSKYECDVRDAWTVEDGGMDQTDGRGSR